jgi:hypothetical protein
VDAVCQESEAGPRDTSPERRTDLVRRGPLDHDHGGTQSPAQINSVITNATAAETSALFAGRRSHRSAEDNDVSNLDTFRRRTYHGGHSRWQIDGYPVVAVAAPGSMAAGSPQTNSLPLSTVSAGDNRCRSSVVESLPCKTGASCPARVPPRAAPRATRAADPALHELSFPAVVVPCRPDPPNRSANLKGRRRSAARRAQPECRRDRDDGEQPPA